MADSFAQRLLIWFEQAGRHDLPWQVEPSPYRVWVSEIMLQQTQVATVIPYFQRFMARFPILSALSQAEIDAVLQLWSGLGYYARARNLHRAAQIVTAEHGGAMPSTLADLTALPGIGRSTAAAILALAHGQPYAILDGNVRRVLTRYHGISGWPGRSAIIKQLWALAESHTPAQRVAEYTQAIMDLGATVCSKIPTCARCPLHTDCSAYATGRQRDLPTPKPARHLPERAVCFLILHDDHHVLLERRPPNGVWGGLLSFPEMADEAAAKRWCQHHGVNPASGFKSWPHLAHTFSHFRLQIKPLILHAESPANRVMDSERLVWYNLDQPPPGGLPKPVAIILEQLNNARRGGMIDDKNGAMRSPRP